jgi:hypothetical protein
MKRLRFATQEEVESIAHGSDIDGNCRVLVLDTPAGVAMAVVRLCVEVDPVYFPPNSSTRIRAGFVRDLETYLSATGVQSYYFNVVHNDAIWHRAVEHWGAQRVSFSPEFRYKKVL